MNEAKLKHLEFIQGVITRMSTNSFLIKGWSVTLVAAIFALAAKDAKPIFAVVAYLPVVIFWVLDAYYLALERRFRKLFETVAANPSLTTDFDMKVSKFSKGEQAVAACAFSRSIFPFYFTLAFVMGVVMWFLVKAE